MAENICSNFQSVQSAVLVNFKREVNRGAADVKDGMLRLQHSPLVLYSHPFFFFFSVSLSCVPFTRPSSLSPPAVCSRAGLFPDHSHLCDCRIDRTFLSPIRVCVDVDGLRRAIAVAIQEGNAMVVNERWNRIADRNFNR
jgi:hypothetical protein